MRYLLTLILLVIIMSCSSSPEVAITQTGNPSQIAITFAIGDSSSSVASRSIRAEQLVTDITITSAIIQIEEVLIDGDEDVVLYDSEPYLINLMLDSSRVILDTADVRAGDTFYSVLLSIGAEDDDTLLDGSSMVITGYLNGDSTNVFEFRSDESYEKEILLEEPLVASDSVPNRITVLFDISNWFELEEGVYIDPSDEESFEEIEESIFESIYGDEDHEEDEEDDEEDENDEEEELEDE